MKGASYKWIALISTSLGTFLAVLNGNTLIIALPEIMKNLHVGMDVIMWIMMSYMLIMTVLVPAIGRIADMVGRKKLYVTGFAVFTFGSALCSFSLDGTQLILARVVQAIGGALLMANGLPIVTDAFPKKQLGSAMGINSMIVNIAVVIGPILGGFLMHFGWRSIFWINIPLGILGTIWGAIQLKELDVLPARQKFDFPGAIYFTFAITLLLAGLSMGAFIGWLQPVTVVSLVVSIFLFVLLVRTEKRAAFPMIDPTLFKSRELTFALLANLLSAVARGSVTFLLVFYYQGIKSLDPVMAGMMLAPFAAAMMVVAPFSGMIADRVGVRALSSAGLLVSGIGLVGLMFLRADTSYLTLGLWMVIMGIGSGMFFSPNTTAIMGSVSVERRGIVSGIRGMTANAGNVLSLALAMAMISTSITPDALQGLFAGTQVGAQGIAIDGFIKGLRTVFTLSFAITLLSAFLSYLRGNGKAKAVA
jgi:EmrB/QacA subfamily drug resistance transporter